MAALHTLLGMPAAGFLAAHWPAQPLFTTGDPARLGALTSDPAVRDIPAFLRAHRGLCQVHVRRADGHVHHESVDAETAVARYAAGAVMDLRDVQRWFAPARALLDALAGELGATAGYCHAFVSPAGTGVDKHFDNREVFAVHLLGAKRWRLAANPAWPLPLMPHAAGGPIHPLNRGAPPAELADPEMPATAATHVLDPGAVVFVPRGHWHDTLALADSLSLSFGFRLPSRVERFTEALTAALADDPAWRATACDLTATDRPASAAAFVAELHRVLAALRSA